VNNERIRWVVAATVLAVVAGGAACASSRPKAVAPPPALAVPVPPARVIDPLPEPVVVAAEPEPEPPPEPARKPARTTRQVRPAEPPKIEPEPTPAPESPPATLRTPSTADPTEAERRVTDTLDRARRLLERVRVGSLDRETRLQFDNAKRFVTQAETALHAKNYLFATYLADKAEALAKDLAGR
jgi:outer membrane biosynthesis protein TonB